MAQGRLSSALSNNTKQKLIPATVVDVLGRKCSVRLSSMGGKLTAIPYLGLQPEIGDEVMVDYRGTNNPVALTTTTQILAILLETPKKKKKLLNLEPTVTIYPIAENQHIEWIANSTPTVITLVGTSKRFGAALTYNIINNPFMGVLSLASGNVITYTSYPTIFGDDHFTFEVIDEIGFHSNLATVSFHVLPPAWHFAEWAEGTDRFSGITYSPSLNRFVGVTGSWTAYSSDGITWEPTNYWDDNTADNMQAVCWSPELELFCAVSTSYARWDGNTTYKNAMTSPDGINWTMRTTSLYADGPYTLSYVFWVSELSLFVAGDGGILLTSPNGANWTVRKNEAPYEVSTLTVWASGLERIISVGTDYMTYSPNGVNWTTVSRPTFRSLHPTEQEIDYSIAYSPSLGKLLRCSKHNVGYWDIDNAFHSTGEPHYAAMLSDDGINWTEHSMPGGDWYGLCWAPYAAGTGLFMAVDRASGKKYTYSPDGINWELGFTTTNIGMSGVVWSYIQNKFVASRYN